MPDNETTPRSKESDQQGWRWTLRRVAAVAIAASAAAVVLASQGFGWAESCQDEIAQVGRESVARICSPLEIGDVAPAFVLALLLFLPDIAEFSAFGVSIRTRLQVQERSQRQLEAEVAEIEVSLASVSSSSASQQQVVVVGPELMKQFEKKEESFASNPDAAIETPAEEENASDNVRDQSFVLLREWTALEPWNRLGRMVQSNLWRGLVRAYLTDELSEEQRVKYGARLVETVPKELDASGLDTVIRWFELFEREINVVRATRNSVAHPSDEQVLDEQVLEESIQIARGSLDALLGALKRRAYEQA